VCQECTGQHDHAVDFAVSRLAVLKAVGPPEFREIIVREAALRDALSKIHREAGGKAVAEAQKQVRAGRPLKAILRAIERAYKAEFEDPAIKAITSQMSHFYALGKRAAWRKALGADRRKLQMDVPLPPEELTGVKKQALEVAPVFDLVDTNAVRALNRHQVFWVGDVYDQQLQRRIAWTTRDVIVRQGLTGEKAADELGRNLKRELDLVPTDYVRPDGVPVPPGWHGTAANYMEGLARNAATVGRVHGSMQAFQQLGVPSYEIINPLDERTCDRCNLMNGKRFPLTAGVGQMDTVLAAKNPAGVKAAHPWRKVSEFKAFGVKHGRGTPGEIRTLTGQGQIMPPFHNFCRCTIDIVPRQGATTQPPLTRTEPAPAPRIPRRSKAPVPPTLPITDSVT
jgi:hypothetical protein